MLAPEPESEPEPRTPAQQPVERPSAADVLENLFGNHAVSDFFFVQVGANVGDTPQDPLYKSVLKYGWHGLLVEPLTHAMEKLRSNYKGCDGLIFEQCAISDEEGDRTLHFPDETDGDFRSLHVDMQTIAKGTASFDADHTNKVCKVQGHSIAMSHEICRCSTMADVLESRQVAPEAVSLLVVDTEGHDHVILNSLDYTVFRPEAILFEHRHTDGTWSFPVRAGQNFNMVNQTLHDAGYTTVRLDLMDTLAVLDPSSLAGLGINLESSRSSAIDARA